MFPRICGMTALRKESEIISPKSSTIWAHIKPAFRRGGENTKRGAKKRRRQRLKNTICKKSEWNKHFLCHQVLAGHSPAEVSRASRVVDMSGLPVLEVNGPVGGRAEGPLRLPGCSDKGKASQVLWAWLWTSSG